MPMKIRLSEDIRKLMTRGSLDMGPPKTSYEASVTTQGAPTPHLLSLSWTARHNNNDDDDDNKNDNHNNHNDSVMFTISHIYIYIYMYTHI